jgi:hypothetical protein
MPSSVFKKSSPPLPLFLEIISFLSIIRFCPEVSPIYRGCVVDVSEASSAPVSLILGRVNVFVSVPPDNFK